MINFLNAIGFTLLEQGYEIGLDWLGQFVRVIIESVGIVGVGIIRSSCAKCSPNSKNCRNSTPTTR